MFDSLCKLFCGNSNSGDALIHLRSVMYEGGIGIVSAKCCSPLASQSDEKLKNNVDIALKNSGSNISVMTISITDARKALSKIKSGDLEPSEHRLVEQIQSLVSTQGFNIFPILIINRKIAFYGGIPEPEKIEKKLLPSEEVA